MRRNIVARNIQDLSIFLSSTKCNCSEVCLYSSGTCPVQRWTRCFLGRVIARSSNETNVTHRTTQLLVGLLCQWRLHNEYRQAKPKPTTRPPNSLPTNTPHLRVEHDIPGAISPPKPHTHYLPRTTAKCLVYNGVVFYQTTHSRPLTTLIFSLSAGQNLVSRKNVRNVRACSDTQEAL